MEKGDIKKGLKNIFYNILTEAFKQSEYNAEFIIKSEVKENEFLGICEEETRKKLFEKYTDKVKNDDYLLNSMIRTYKFSLVDKLPEEERTFENYIDFLATTIMPFYEEENDDIIAHTDFSFEDYPFPPAQKYNPFQEEEEEEKYNYWKDILFNDFVETFDAFAIIELLNNTKQAKATETQKQPSDFKQSEKPEKKEQQKQFSDKIIAQNKDNILSILHELIDKRKGREVALIITAAIKKGVILKPTYTEIKNEFGDIGNKSGFNSYMNNKFRFPVDELTPIMDRF